MEFDTLKIYSNGVQIETSDKKFITIFQHNGGTFQINQRFRGAVALKYPPKCEASKHMQDIAKRLAKKQGVEIPKAFAF